MDTTSGKRTARVKVTLTKRTVENLQPTDKPWIAWDDRLSGFGVRVQPSGTKVFLVNYRTRSGGRRARNRRVGIGRCDHLAPEEARRLAQELLGRVARGEEPAQERADRRGMPTLREAFAEYLTANPNRKRSTEALYRSQMRYCLGDWQARPLDTITRRDVEARFHLVSQRNGWAVANHIIALLRSVYRRPCVDHESLRNPVDLWLAGGGRYHRAVRRRISTPAETLPRWRSGRARRRTGTTVRAAEARHLDSIDDPARITTGLAAAFLQLAGSDSGDVHRIRDYGRRALLPLNPVERGVSSTPPWRGFNQPVVRDPGRGAG